MRARRVFERFSLARFPAPETFREVAASFVEVALVRPRKKRVVYEALKFSALSVFADARQTQIDIAAPAAVALPCATLRYIGRIGARLAFEPALPLLARARSARADVRFDAILARAVPLPARSALARLPKTIAAGLLFPDVFFSARIAGTLTQTPPPI